MIQSARSILIIHYFMQLKKQITLYLVLFLLPLALHASLTPAKLVCENLHNPMVVDIPEPRLSWINTCTGNIRGQVQTAYEIMVAGSLENLQSGNAGLWKSGKVISNESVNIPYGGKPLVSMQDCWWRVRVWDGEGKVSDWSEAAFWSMGLLDQQEWVAQWIGAPWQDETPLPRPSSPGRNYFYNPGSPSEDLPPPAPMLRKSFSVEKEVFSARAFVTGLGFFEFYLNGEKVGDDVLVPNVTLYDERGDLGDIGVMIEDNFREYRVMYLAYDITDLLNSGENVAGAMLGNGFYNPANYWSGGYGTPKFFGQIHVTYADGSEDIIVSDGSWKVSKGPVIMDLVYDGEHYDARMEQPGWCSPGFDDSGWQYAAARNSPKGKMKAHMSPTDKVMERLTPKTIEHIGQGHYKVDFGEEISGWLRLKDIAGEAGHTISINYITESMMGDNTYTLKGGKPESYAARFTWFVFREVELINWPGELRADQIIAEAVYSDVKTTGHFESSSELFNTINTIWWRAQTDNMHGGIVSDCPHRERNPYNGDGQVACVTVLHNFDVRAFYTKWIRDIFGSQNPENGYVPNCSPWQPGCGGGVAWGAAMIIMPWEYYLHYGDIDMLKTNYPGMKGYIDYMMTWTDDDGIMHSQAPDPENPNRWINLGDWVAPYELPPADMVHTFYLWRCADLTSKSARALGRYNEAEEYSALAEKTRRAFHGRFYDNKKGSYGPYGGNIFALKMGVPPQQHDRVTASLKADIEANDGHLDTGIFGTQFFFEVLSANGLHELAYEAMNKRTFPGYGWWIEQGATTTWEKWDGTNSRNHPMFGGGIVWFYRVLAGMKADPERPGYRNIVFRPQPVEEITFASYSNLTPYGTAAIKWKKEGATFHMDITVPVGSTATVYIPAKENGRITESGESLGDSENIRFRGMEGEYAVLNINSGIYQFESE
ncbi:MAG: family 78 glycoside hydrolase catalytic domain [Bacteroidales bacterium]